MEEKQPGGGWKKSNKINPKNKNPKGKKLNPMDKKKKSPKPGIPGHQLPKKPPVHTTKK